MSVNQSKALDCLKAAKLLYARGLVNVYEGNVSVRLKDTILITPSAVCKEELEPEDLVEVEIATGKTVYAKPGRVASSELKMHLCIYKSRADLQGVVHAHPPFATAFAVAGKPIDSMGYPEMRVLYDHVPICRYGRPSTEDVNVDIPAVLKTHDAFLIGNHGLVAVAETALVAAYRIEGVESIAKVLTLVKLHGGEKPLPKGECEAISDIYRNKRGIL